MSSSPAVVFDHVSKTFMLHRSRTGRSFQELLIGLFGHRNSSLTSFTALDDVSFILDHGKTYGLIGANGAGKSTALKLVARIIEPDTGSIAVKGQLGALLELGAGFHPELSGRENVYLSGSVMGFDREYMHRRFDEIVAFSELGDFIDVPVKHYSSGMYVRLGFSVAVHAEPEILLIDEVLAVGDASFQQKCLNRITRLRERGVTVVLVSHDMGAIQTMCDHVLWFDGGQLMLQGQATDVVLAYTRTSAERKIQMLRRHLSGRQALRASEESIAGSTSHHTSHSVDGRWGTGPLRITHVEFREESGAPSDSFATGAPMEIRVHYETEEPIEDPIFGLAVHHQNGVHLCGPNTLVDGWVISHVSGQGVVSYRVPFLPLLEGLYQLSVSVHDRADQTMYDYHDRLYPFYVCPSDTRGHYGIITLNGRWEHQRG